MVSAEEFARDAEIKKEFDCYTERCDPTDVKCSGGLDPAAGQLRQPPCDLFEKCRMKTNQRMTGQYFIPVSSLTRPPAATTAGYPSMPVRVAPLPQPAPPPPAPLSQAAAPPLSTPSPLATWASRLPAPPSPSALRTPSQPQTLTPVATNIQYIAQDYHMPGYLRTPETRQPGESYWGPLTRELLRGGLKALGHTLAGFVDVNPFSKEDKDK